MYIYIYNKELSICHLGKRQNSGILQKKHQMQKIYIGNVMSEWNELKENLKIKNDIELSSLLIKRYT